MTNIEAMKVLIIKMSSLGDVIHTLPAITDAARAIKGIQFDWVVESSFQEIPAWHPNVNRIIPIQLRKWRKNLYQAYKSKEIPDFITQLKQTRYDVVLDAQGLIKSALVARLANGPRRGLSRQCAREPLASLFYQHGYFANPKQHAVEKVRQLFAQALGYPYQQQNLDYGIDIQRLEPKQIPEPYVMFLHGTTWSSKHWPDEYWCSLAEKLSAQHIQVVMSWGNAIEKIRAESIRKFCVDKQLKCLPIIVPKCSLSEITYVIAHAQAAVAVDTGLGHIAAMMNVPTISLYGPTYPGYTGAYGNQQTHLVVAANCHPCFEKKCPLIKAPATEPPCYQTLLPERVVEHLQPYITRQNTAQATVQGTVRVS